MLNQWFFRHIMKDMILDHLQCAIHCFSGRWCRTPWKPWLTSLGKRRDWWKSSQRNLRSLSKRSTSHLRSTISDAAREELLWSNRNCVSSCISSRKPFQKNRWWHRGVRQWDLQRVVPTSQYHSNRSVTKSMASFQPTFMTCAIGKRTGWKYRHGCVKCLGYVWFMLSSFSELHFLMLPILWCFLFLDAVLCDFWDHVFLHQVKRQMAEDGSCAKLNCLIAEVNQFSACVSALVDSPGEADSDWQHQPVQKG